ncbi:MAG: hypothetical protein U7M05_06575 [Candidatus Igneacidithiobacillus chanchocoensis]
MFIVKVLFTDTAALHAALQNIRSQRQTLGDAPPEISAALDLLLQEEPRIESTEFAEKPAIAAVYGGFEPQAAAIVEAAFLEAGALQVIQE